jgi:hypothetical protein
MKRTVICIIIFILLVISGIISNYYVKNFTDEVLDGIQEIIKYEEEQNAQQRIMVAQQVTQRWEKFLEQNYFYSDREHLLEITKCMINIEYLSKDGGDELLGECHTAMRLIEIYHHQQSFSFQTII